MAGASAVIVGGGKMGEAILRGWLASNDPVAAGMTPETVVVVEPSAERRAYLSGECGVTCVEDAACIEPGQVGMVVLAVKPQVMMSVLEGVRANPAFCAGQAAGQAEVQAAGQAAGQAEVQPTPPLFVSIAAGLTTERLESALPEGAALVRVMPNLPLSIGAGASGVCKGARSTDDQVAQVAALFGCLGRAVVVDESLMDVVCALSGSGPAYVAAMVESLRDAAVSEGLDAQLAETLALQTVLGTARLIDESDLSVQATREAVCSPGGTTLAALDAMAQAGFDEVFEAGVRAAVKRSKELAQS